MKIALVLDVNVCDDDYGVVMVTVVVSIVVSMLVIV